MKPLRSLALLSDQELRFLLRIHREHRGRHRFRLSEPDFLELHRILAVMEGSAA
jgi:hypothetical protein